MPKYLLEIGTEELPAQYLSEAEAQLAESLRLELTNNHLDFAGITTMSTPRRLTLIVNHLAPVQCTVEKTVKGPPAKSAFDQSGNPLPPALGFASKHNLKTDQLTREEINGVMYLVAHLKIAGVKAQQLLSEIVPIAIKQLSGERMMRWGTQDLKFSRPIRWIVSLLDDEIVPFQFAQLQAGRTSSGHRTLSQGLINITHVDQYIETMRGAGVIVNPAERRQLIEKQVSELAHSVKGKARHIHDSLLQEVVNLTECPQAILGHFAPAYLELPDLLIETVMIHHQRYFPVEKAQRVEANSNNSDVSGNLLPYFVAISNNTAAGAQDKTRLGNERVLKARLADGRFFYLDDQKTTLSQRRKTLAQLTFQGGLGSYEAKILRLLKAAESICEQLKLAPEEIVHLKRAIELCKADLVSNLVRELPELQGYVGSWYAAYEKEAPAVVRAIASHYSPRFPEDPLPADLLGKLISLLDKLDSVAGAIVLGRKPSSSGDPFAVRRQTQGLIDIGLSLDQPVNIFSLAKLSIEALSLENNRAKAQAPQLLDELLDFLKQRLHTRLIEDGFSRNVVEAVTAVGEPLANLPDIKARLIAVASFVAEEANHDILRSGVRLANILNGEGAGMIEATQFTEAAERQLYDGLKELNRTLELNNNKQSYKSYLAAFRPITGLIDNFFEDIMVNDENPEKRRNRRALLAGIDQHYKQIADFSKLQSLLN